MSDPGQGRESPSPSAYRRNNPYQAPPPDYKPPSMLAEHRGLAVVFGVLSVAFAVYCLRTPHPRAAAAQGAQPRSSTPAPPPASQAQPIYIEALPDQPAH